jgi:hypothetical protein
MTGSATESPSRYRRIAVRVILVECITIAVLWWLQSRYSA